MPARRGDLAEDADLGHLPVGELEDELIDLEAEHRVEDRPVGPAGERAAEVVPEAQMRTEPCPTDDRARSAALKRAEKSAGGVGMDGRRRLVDLDEVGAGGDQALAAPPAGSATNASAAALRSR